MSAPSEKIYKDSPGESEWPVTADQVPEVASVSALILKQRPNRLLHLSGDDGQGDPQIPSSTSRILGSFLTPNAKGLVQRP